MDIDFDKVKINLLAIQTAVAALREGNESVKGLHDLQKKIYETIVNYDHVKRAMFELQQQWANLPHASSPPPLD